jgi:hypothetical protein
MNNELKSVLKLRKDGLPMKRQPRKLNVTKVDEIVLTEKLKTYATTYTTESIIVSFN